MKKHKLIPVIVCLALACTNTEKKDSVEIADSINKANMDTAINSNKTTVDETSAAFLVKAAHTGMVEVDLGALGTQKAVSVHVKTLASMLVSDHSASLDQVQALAAQKNITLPDSMSSDKRKEIDKLKSLDKKGFDKAFMDQVVKDHEEAVKLFENALTGTKDPEINSFADRTLMKLRMHLDSAKAVRSSLK